MTDARRRLPKSDLEIAAALAAGETAASLAARLGVAPSTITRAAKRAAEAPIEERVAALEERVAALESGHAARAHDDETQEQGG